MTALDRFREAAADALAQLAADHLEPGCRLTLVMRHPDKAECWAVVTDDAPAEVGRLLGRSEEDGRPHAPEGDGR